MHAAKLWRKIEYERRTGQDLIGPEDALEIRRLIARSIEAFMLGLADKKPQQTEASDTVGPPPW